MEGNTKFYDLLEAAGKEGILLACKLLYVTYMANHCHWATLYGSEVKDVSQGYLSVYIGPENLRRVHGPAGGLPENGAHAAVTQLLEPVERFLKVDWSKEGL